MKLRYLLYNICSCSRKCRRGCTLPQRCRWTFSGKGWSWLMKDELCNWVYSSAKLPGRWSTLSWSSSWPGALSAHGGYHWHLSASYRGSHLPGWILSAWKNLSSETFAIIRDSYLPRVKGDHYEEIYCLLYHCGLMPHPLLSFFLFEYRLKVELIIWKYWTESVQKYF